MTNPFISVADLQSKLNQGVVILDCRFTLAKGGSAITGIEYYRQGHIPGAHYIDLERHLSGPLAKHGGRHPLPDAQSFTHTLQTVGISQQTPVVVYDDSRMAFAARAWWLLRYFGHSNVKILDGGYRAWKAAGGAEDRREPGSKPGRFSAHEQVEWTRSYQEIATAPENFTLIDSREARRYAGLEEPLDPIAGHIPGALNFPWQDATDDQGFFKPPQWHQQRWKDIVGNKNVTVYCGSGVTACVNLLSLNVAGITARLYPGSWSDWCSYQNID
jgi:thiosulfate/3-mercaptopyruvate sulfurtransferase